MATRWNPPPNWPAPPTTDWQPPAEWQPEASWGPAPQGWQFWVDDATGAPAAVPAPAAAAAPAPKGTWFGRHKILTGVGALLALGVVVSALSNGGDNTAAASDTKPAASASSTSAAGKPAPAKTAAKPVAKPAAVSQLGKPLRDGKFEFVVKKVKCGRQLVGTQDFGKKAQGQFCEIAITVKNIGDEPQSLMGDNQYLFDSQGRKFSADTEAAVYMDQANTLYEEINPGNSLSGVLLYDVPKGAKLTRMELHDSMLSGGVKLTL